MLALKQNPLYQSTYKSFEQSNFEESIQTVQGFILGLLAQGLNSSDNASLKLAQEILNNDTPLTGKSIAVFTTLLLELERDLKQNKIQFFLPQAEDQVNQDQRLKALGDTAYGALLGLSIPQQKIPFNVMADPKAAKEQAMKSKTDRYTRERLEMLEQIANIDPEDVKDFSEEDYELVTTEMGAIISEFYTKNHIHG